MWVYKSHAQIISDSLSTEITLNLASPPLSLCLCGTGNGQTKECIFVSVSPFLCVYLYYWTASSFARQGALRCSVSCSIQQSSSVWRPTMVCSLGPLHASWERTWAQFQVALLVKSSLLPHKKWLSSSWFHHQVLEEVSPRRMLPNFHQSIATPPPGWGPSPKAQSCNRIRCGASLSHTFCSS